MKNNSLPHHVRAPYAPRAAMSPECPRPVRALFLTTAPRAAVMPFFGPECPRPVRTLKELPRGLGLRGLALDLPYRSKELLHHGAIFGQHRIAGGRPPQEGRSAGQVARRSHAS